MGKTQTQKPEMQLASIEGLIWSKRRIPARALACGRSITTSPCTFHQLVIMKLVVVLLASALSCAQGECLAPSASGATLSMICLVNAWQGLPCAYLNVDQ